MRPRRPEYTLQKFVADHLALCSCFDRCEPCARASSSVLRDLARVTGIERVTAEWREPWETHSQAGKGLR